jgi:shikimate dehydrogenase
MYHPASSTDLLVQATSIGLYPDVDARAEVDLTPLKPGTIVCDVIPNPPRTRLMQEALERKLIALDGLGMLVNQGVIGIELWTGQSPDSIIMRQALETVFSE